MSKFLLMQIIVFSSLALYGIYGSHTTESCPLSNIRSRNIVLKMAQDLDNIASKNKITILDQYHSALEHTFLWTVDAESAHSAERFMIELQWSVFNALKIVPLGRYENVVEACKKLDAA
jgi:hypothetical protein